MITHHSVHIIYSTNESFEHVRKNLRWHWIQGERWKPTQRGPVTFFSTFYAFFTYVHLTGLQWFRYSQLKMGKWSQSVLILRQLWILRRSDGIDKSLCCVHRFPGVPQELQEENDIQYKFEVYESIEHHWGWQGWFFFQVVCNFYVVNLCFICIYEQIIKKKKSLAWHFFVNWCQSLIIPSGNKPTDEANLDSLDRLKQHLSHLWLRCHPTFVLWQLGSSRPLQPWALEEASVENGWIDGYSLLACSLRCDISASCLTPSSVFSSLTLAFVWLPDGPSMKPAVIRTFLVRPAL